MTARYRDKPFTRLSIYCAVRLAGVREPKANLSPIFNNGTKPQEPARTLSEEIICL